MSGNSSCESSKKFNFANSLVSMCNDLFEVSPIYKTTQSLPNRVKNCSIISFCKTLCSPSESSSGLPLGSFTGIFSMFLFLSKISAREGLFLLY